MTSALPPRGGNQDPFGLGWVWWEFPPGRSHVAGGELQRHRHTGVVCVYVVRWGGLTGGSPSGAGWARVPETSHQAPGFPRTLAGVGLEGFGQL